jgi:hypothetical protein
MDGSVVQYGFLVFSARRCCRRSRVRAPVGPGTFLRRNINIGLGCASSNITFLRPSKLHIGLQTIHYLHNIDPISIEKIQVGMRENFKSITNPPFWGALFVTCDLLVSPTWPHGNEPRVRILVPRGWTIVKMVWYPSRPKHMVAQN